MGQSSADVPNPMPSSVGALAPMHVLRARRLEEPRMASGSVHGTASANGVECSFQLPKPVAANREVELTTHTTLLETQPGKEQAP
ncbi:uncharacterized protein ColSpa_08867 [Colletotrichum spaethianum]|uniref:Uncharacterized protein n=1 Tax=Colletotrichum spaethianum TaxID=700344 RepID=A0AA37PAN2_9PEZI|nr:uncharacterized protein ColSpa_08867 [Colletotrichum spaethianum]GKT48686.1 hypothetical protein ColSpa_08867 [Colletotrichum spaethianum]